MRTLRQLSKLRTINDPKTEQVMDSFFKRAKVAQDDLNDILVALAPRSSIERRSETPRIKRQEAYEAAAHYLRDAGEHYTAALVEEALRRIDRRKQSKPEISGVTATLIVIDELGGGQK